MKRSTCWIMLTLLLAGTVFLGFDIRPARADTVTIYINSDGSVSPSLAPISTSDNVTYSFTGNISYPAYFGIVVRRSNIVIEGNGYTVQGNQSGNGLSATDKYNITIRDVNVQGFTYGIYLYDSPDSTIIGNSATADTEGIYVRSSSNTIVSGNSATSSLNGIDLYYSPNDTVSSNTVSTNNSSGILLYSSNNTLVNMNAANNNGFCGVCLYSTCSNDTVTGNTANANPYGVYIYLSSNNTLNENTISANTADGFSLDTSSNNRIYHNNIVNNSAQFSFFNSLNSWDNGYPSGGNYWSDYNGSDANSDGIGDTQYVMTGNNTDRYPLMGWFGSSTSPGLNVTVFPSDDVGLIFQNVTTLGSTMVNELPVFAPVLSNLLGEYYSVTVSASFSGNVTVRLIFDGSDLTLNQKSHLHLMEYTPLPGDITGPIARMPDGKVDIRDISFVAKHFGTTRESENWDPIADLTGRLGRPDGKVDIYDIAFVARRFGTSTSWIDITESVDTTNNVIYGVTTHFSIIGIHQE